MSRKIRMFILGMLHLLGAVYTPLHLIEACNDRLMTPLPWRFTNSQRRSFVSSLFALTFAGAIVTVSAPTLLPCPARKRRERRAGGPFQETEMGSNVVVVGGPRRWIKEKGNHL